jgi:hypothetical protein
MFVPPYLFVIVPDHTEIAGEDRVSRRGSIPKEKLPGTSPFHIPQWTQRRLLQRRNVETTLRIRESCIRPQDPRAPFRLPLLRAVPTYRQRRSLQIQ